ncbi:MAG TPA: type II toxin-antitoxin system HicB family antitoxin [Candidatus Wolfebacteria bacterium]|nr:type II toxin-antitoxin system HicB family antitoxin [Candidatus Wolfebacteria bacterium]
MKKQYHFSIIIEQDENGYFVFCPELQGCYSQGITHEEAVENIKDAIKLHLEDRFAAHEKLTETKSVSLSTVEVAV